MFGKIFILPGLQLLGTNNFSNMKLIPAQIVFCSKLPPSKPGSLLSLRMFGYFLQAGSAGRHRTEKLCQLALRTTGNAYNANILAFAYLQFKARHSLAAGLDFSCSPRTGYPASSGGFDTTHQFTRMSMTIEEFAELYYPTSLMCFFKPSLQNLDKILSSRVKPDPVSLDPKSLDVALAVFSQFSRVSFRSSILLTTSF